MEEIAKVRILYQDKEYELGEQELDRIISITSKRLRGEIVASRFGLGIFSVKDLAEEAKLNPGVRVMKNGFESEFYKAMNETLIYAVETDMLENYRVDKSKINMEPNNLHSAIRNDVLKPIKDNSEKKLEESPTLKTKKLDMDITEIYSRKLQNFFELLSGKILAK